jgi:hypothetical protein
MMIFSTNVLPSNHLNFLKKITSTGIPSYFKTQQCFKTFGYWLILLENTDLFLSTMRKDGNPLKHIVTAGD